MCAADQAGLLASARVIPGSRAIWNGPKCVPVLSWACGSHRVSSHEPSAMASRMSSSGVTASMALTTESPTPPPLAYQLLD